MMSSLRFVATCGSCHLGEAVGTSAAKRCLIRAPGNASDPGSAGGKSLHPAHLMRLSFATRNLCAASSPELLAALVEEHKAGHSLAGGKANLRHAAKCVPKS